jgi:hypothetical protein
MRRVVTLTATVDFSQQAYDESGESSVEDFIIQEVESMNDFGNYLTIHDLVVDDITE